MQGGEERLQPQTDPRPGRGKTTGITTGDFGDVSQLAVLLAFGEVPHLAALLRSLQRSSASESTQAISATFLSSLSWWTLFVTQSIV